MYFIIQFWKIPSENGTKICFYTRICVPVFGRLWTIVYEHHAVIGGFVSEHLFQIHSKYEPAGDQPKAIAELVEGIESKKPFQVLLGATGTGKTFTIAQVVQTVQKPTLVLAHNKTLAAQLYAELKRNSFPIMRFNTLFPTTTTINQKPTFRRPIITYQKTRVSMNRSINCVTLRHRRC